MTSFRQILDQLEVAKETEKQELKAEMDVQVANLKGGNTELENKVVAITAELEDVQMELKTQLDAKDAEIAELRVVADKDKAKLKAQIGQVTTAAQLHAQQLLAVARTNAKQLEANAQQKAKELEREGLKKAAGLEQEAQAKVKQVQAELAKAQQILAAEKTRQEAARCELAKEAARQVRDRHNISKKQAACDSDTASVSAASTHDTETMQFEQAQFPQEWAAWNDKSHYAEYQPPMYQQEWSDPSETYDAGFMGMGGGYDASYDNAGVFQGGCVYYS